MSRCFRFPPPGYEKKLNLDDANLLAKAKHKEKKEKKHKKDKKDKEKKEGKEKDKDRSKKKEKKEKHRDKNPEKNNPGEEKRIEGHVGSSSLQSNHLAESSYVQELARRIKDDDGATGRKIVDKSPVTTQKQAEPSKNVVAINVINKSERNETSKGSSKSASKNNVHEKKGDFETKVRRVAIVHSLGGMEHKRVDTVKPIEKDVTKAVEWKDKEKPHVSGSKGGDKSIDKGERKINRQVEHFNGNNFVSNRAQNCRIKENGFVQEFEGRGRDGCAAPKGQFVDKNIETDQKRAGFMGIKNVDTNQKRENVGRMVESNNSTYNSEGKGVSNNGNGIYTKSSAQSDKARAPKVSFVHNLSRAAEPKRVEGLDPMEKGVKRAADGKEKCKQEDKSVERTEAKVRESGGEPNKKMFRIKEVVREPVDGTESSLLKDINKTSVAEESAKKRKLPEINGFLHDNEIRPSKLQRPSSSSGHPPIVNGRKLDEASSIIPPSAPKEKGIAISHRIQVKKEHRPNGVTDPLQSKVSLTISASNHRSSASALKEKGNAINLMPEGETKINGFSDPCQTTVKLSTSSSSASKSKKSHKTPPVKPPHPDSKYLSEILSVPKMEDLVELHTEDWLFNCSPKKPKVCGSSEAESQSQVWEKVLVIESADISALPYVIPY